MNSSDEPAHHVEHHEDGGQNQQREGEPKEDVVQKGSFLDLLEIEEIEKKRQKYNSLTSMIQAQEVKQRESIGSFIQRESFKLLQTTTTAVMANSLEGLRLQSRMLSPNTPEQRTLKLAQSQNATLKDIRRLLQNINLGSGAALKVRSV